MLLAWLCCITPPAFAKPPLDYQGPPPDPPAAGRLDQPSEGQLPGSLPPDHVTGPGNFRRLPMIDESEWAVVAVRDEPYWKAGKPDPLLTNACRLGDFGSLPLNRMVVRFTAAEGRGVLQVVLPDRRHLLVDKRRLARDGETYYFHDSGLPSCQVWFAGKGKARPIDRKRGTSLPPADPRALAKRKALIDSWP